jgi:hypothetical protein
MRIKFEKGMTPEAIAETFVDFIYKNNLLIGSVNMYVQTYDDHVKAQKTEDYFVCSPGDKTKKDYTDYAADLRRRKFKAVSNG